MRFSLAIILTMVMVMSVKAQKGIRQQEFPGGEDINQTSVEWQQMVYRELDLTEEENAALYSAADQEEKLTGLFAHIFNMMVNGNLKIYKYNIDGNEKLTPRYETNVKEFLNDFHIEHQEGEDGEVYVNSGDVPYADVTMFFVKETVYYNISNSSFRRKVLALCPVMVVEDEFSDEPVRYPLFWVRYADLEPGLKSVYFNPDAQNIALSMTMDDFFSLNRYKGEIYKVNGQTIKKEAEAGNDSVRKIENAKVTEKINSLQRTTYNVYTKEEPVEERKAEEETQGIKKEKKSRAEGKRWSIQLPWRRKVSEGQTENK